MSKLKPVLYIDIDGVLCPFGFQDDPEGYFMLFVEDEHWVHVSHENTRRLRELGEYFELRWGTMWENDANVFLSPFHNLPILPFVPFSNIDIFPDELAFFKHAKNRNGTYKLPWIQDHVGDRPVAWIDDDIHHDALRWADERKAATLVLKTNPSIGLTDEHVATLIEWTTKII